MRPITIFHHSCLNINYSHAVELLQIQIDALSRYGLLEAAKYLVFCINGTPRDACIVKSMVPERSEIIVNDEAEWGSGEVPTINFLRERICGCPEHNVLYFHMKGLSTPRKHPLYQRNRNWMYCMQSVVVLRWRECVYYLERDRDSCGIHWKTPEELPGMVTWPYWAGNFWWATQAFLITLPKINTEGHVAGGRYEAEVWIGKGPRRPKVKDFAAGNRFRCTH